MISEWQKAKDEIANSCKQSSIYIGCDSLVVGDNKVHYSTVVVLHRGSRNGCRVFHKSITLPNYGSMRARLLQEVQLALEAYYQIEDVINGRHLEVHLDLNNDSKHASNIVTSEALGWVRSMGLTAKIKPDAFAATHAADRFVRKFS